MPRCQSCNKQAEYYWAPYDEPLCEKCFKKRFFKTFLRYLRKHPLDEIKCFTLLYGENLASRVAYICLEKLRKTFKETQIVKLELNVKPETCKLSPRENAVSDFLTEIRDIVVATKTDKTRAVVIPLTLNEISTLALLSILHGKHQINTLATVLREALLPLEGIHEKNLVTYSKLVNITADYTTLTDELNLKERNSLYLRVLHLLTDFELRDPSVLYSVKRTFIGITELGEHHRR